jgi:hypothetical protein
LVRFRGSPQWMRFRGSETSMWFRGLRCVSVLVGVVGVKGAFGVRCADRTSSTLDVMKERGLRSSLVTLVAGWGC